MNTFKIGIENLQPSQIYINQAKLDKVMGWISKEDESKIIFPVININGRITLTDGHTRLLALYLVGNKEFLVEWDEDEIDHKAYEKCVEWCINDSIISIADLEHRILSAELFNELWIERCSKMHNELELL